MICNVPPAIGGAEIPCECSGCNAPFVNTLSCRSTSLTVAVGISVSLAITVAWRHATPLAPSTQASRNTAVLVRPLRKIKLLLCNCRILQSEPLARLQSLGDQRLIPALSRDFHRRFFKLRASPHVRDGSSRFPEKGIRRNHNSIGHSIHSDTNSRSHSRRQARIAPAQAEFHCKVSRHWPSCSEVQTSCRAYCVDTPVEIPIRQRIEPHARRLTQLQLPSFRLFHACRNLERRTIRQLRNSRARPRSVAGFESCWAPLRLPMILQRYHAVQRRP